jgi:hypothetical protein
MRLEESVSTSAFAVEIQERLQRMRAQPYSGEPWPEGCYGSAASWLVFVGPSPGGGTTSASPRERLMSGGTPFWNADFSDPVEKWSKGFRTSMRPLVETIVGLPFDRGAAKVFSVLNFHWQQNPKAALVPEEGMRSGAAATRAVLECLRPRVVVSMEEKTDCLLRDLLVKAKYSLSEPAKCSALVSINTKGRAHRQLRGYLITGDGALANTIVVRSPQHPAWIHNAEYALRCARAIKSFVLQVHAGETCVSIEGEGLIQPIERTKTANSAVSPLSGITFGRQTAIANTESPWQSKTRRTCPLTVLR